MVNHDRLGRKCDIATAARMVNDWYGEVLEDRHAKNAAICGESMVVNGGVQVKLCEAVNVERRPFSMSLK